MSPVLAALGTEPTAQDLVERFGPLPLARLRTTPPAGTATEDDLLALNESKEHGLFELVEGFLVQKTMGAHESRLAARLILRLAAFVEERLLGEVFAPDGMMRLAPGLVRVPDVSFVSRERLPGGTFPGMAFVEGAPDLAVEILSPGNTRREMERKLADYFAAGTRLVWYIDPRQREATVYTAPDAGAKVGADGALDGGAVLPGFRLPLAELLGPPPAA